ncbi:MAG: DUF1828 domain-containing protein [Gemmatimonadetes bacterium]|jgi:hypothetical protein|nr:DUF1828 domain-containing protein [Gemmatimonadota bacterium]
MNGITLDHLSNALCDELASGIELRPRDDRTVVLLPFVDGYGDSLAVVIEEAEEGFFLTDEGYTFGQVAEFTGTTDSGAAVWRRLGEIALRHGVTFEGVELLTDAPDMRAVARGLLRLSSAITEALHIGRLSVPAVGVPFDEEIKLFLRDHQIPFETNQQVIGSSKAPHRVDFIIRNSKEIVAQAIGSEQSMRRALNIFYDLTELSGDYIPVAFLDDEKEGYSNTTYTQLSYKADVFAWSQRNRFLEYWYRKHTAPQDTATRPIPEPQEQE